MYIYYICLIIDSPGHCHPKVLILLALLVSWMDDEEFVKKDFEVIEYFAGCGRIALLSHYVGYQTAAYDLDYGSFKASQCGRKNSLDLNSNAGFCLAIKLILRSQFNQLIAIFAICLSPSTEGQGNETCWWRRVTKTFLQFASRISFYHGILFPATIIFLFGIFPI